MKAVHTSKRFGFSHILKSPKAVSLVEMSLSIAALLVLLYSGKSTADEATAPVAEENILTLETAINEALKHSPVVQRAQASVSEKGWHQFEAIGAGFLPKVSISANHYFDQKFLFTTMAFSGFNTVFPGLYATTQASLDVNVPIFNGFANVHQVQAASLLHDAAESDLSHAEFQLSEDIQLGFYQALAATELNLVSEQNVRTLEDHLAQIQIQRRGGVATNYDMLRVEVQLSEARADAIDTIDQVELTRKKLAQLLGLPSDTRKIQGTLPVPDATNVKNLELKDVPRERRDIQALSQRAEAASKLESARNVWLVPQVSVGGQYQWYDSQVYTGTVTNTGIYKNAYNLGVFLKWNLFDGGVSLAQARQSDYQAVQADKTSELAKQQIPYDFAYWKRRYLSNTDHYLSKKFDITRSNESVRLAKAEQRAGTRTTSDTLDAELDLFRARAGVVNAQVNAAEARIRLELALGRRIPQ